MWVCPCTPIWAVRARAYSTARLIALTLLHWQTHQVGCALQKNLHALGLIAHMSTPWGQPYVHSVSLLQSTR